MGIVKQQAYKNTIVLYTGMVIAYINTVLLFPPIVGDDNFGFYNLVISVSVLYSLVSAMGVPSIIARYFPFYRTEDGKHNGFIHWVAFLSFIGFGAATALYLIFKPAIIGAYAQSSPLFVKYYYYMIPLALFIIAFNFLEMMGRAVYRTIFSNVLQFVVLRLATTVMLLMIAQKWLTFEDFIFGYIIVNGLISLILMINLLLAGSFKMGRVPSSLTSDKKQEMFNFGMFTLVSGSVYTLLQKVDTLMLSSMASDAVTGVYSWYFNIAMVISIPAQALSRTTYAIVADSWRTKNMANIADIYAKTSIIQLVVGMLLFIGIFINRDNLYALARNKDFTDPKYFTLFIVIGLGFLADITGGLNSYIITTSHKYRLVTLITVIMCIICVGLNYLLIPVYQGLGSAIAYFITIVGMNFATWLYIKIRFKMQPFTYKHLLVLVIAVICYFIGFHFWRLPNVWLDIMVRSGVTAIVYALLTYLFKISADVNEKVDELIAKFVRK
ncbi:oligosaccharide flippase family protein [Mucilaginibacter roseus]|uniref:Oligosaccharide flippase family protein n=1 Tax=Mucilaginibacter roseus TaxID=1528868 RepID=A0ABS8U186_9SPHI|nr:oligosaccharide flippase family protein [Mucilaginibacter roseus]MCD8740869.1 oligosaccharide flippase family protein [Mucilaginibacter roseus]